MARGESIIKRAKISKAQQNMLLAVGGTAIFLGVTIALTMHFSNSIAFNGKVIEAEDKAMTDYTSAISKLGVCRKPAGNSQVYTDQELKACNPNSIDAASVPNTLRSDVMEKVAASTALNSVPNQASSECINRNAGRNYTYAELQGFYQDALETENEDNIMAATKLMQKCSALRVIPDALPSYRNEEALLSSLNKIFLVSGWEPEALSPTEESSAAAFGRNLNTISVRLAVEANSGTTMEVLRNIERSIREFNILRANIEWGSNNTLVLNASATAYYMEPITFTESTKRIAAGN